MTEKNGVERSTATDVLRRLLDERGVEWMPSVWSAKDETFYKVGDVGYLATELSSGKMKVCIEGYPTPEQVIAATLGSCNVGRYVGLRQGEYWERTENSNYYCGGCGWKVTDHDSYCPECGGALHNATLGSCSCSDSCTNGERTETCEADETDLIPFVRADSDDFKVDYIHVMECTECGHTYEHVNGDYEYCPRCGRKRKDVEQ